MDEERGYIKADKFQLERDGSKENGYRVVIHVVLNK